jgi:glycosyltransferase involved in cell wall biosynthesis
MIQDTNIENVLIVTPNNLQGGSDLLLEELALEFSAQGYKVTIVCFMDLSGPGWKNLPESIHLRFLNVGSYYIGILKLLGYLFFQRKNVKYKICLSTNVHINATLGIAKQIGLLNVQNLIVRESTPIFNRYKGLELFLYRMRYLIGYRSIDQVICQTKKMEATLLKEIPFLKSKSRVLLNPINVEKVFNATISNLVINNNKPYIIAAGRLMKIKGFHLLIDAYHAIEGEKPDLLILGEGEEHAHLTKQIETLGLQGKVILKGHERNPYPYYRNAVLSVVCSEIEGFPNTILQMLALNNSCICTACCDGLNEIPALWVIPTKDVYILQKAIEKFLHRNPFSADELEEKKNYLNGLSIQNYIKQLQLNLV